ncbi:hypothetical protein Glove_107g4 [Diversispora epigaea]|uniref:Uncharacterized protein n=1 Tax=Diversispora epigaea TaxID=1348612 RepID=A0A397J374_9GLOM|nr:hypothetical protein Glove_107g4 [Diversispora epigaea]
MSTELYQMVHNFFTTSLIEYITAFSIIYQVIEDEPLIQQDVLREIVNRAIDASTNIYSNNLIAQNKLLRISIQFNNAFEGVRSVYNIKRAKLKRPLTKQEINRNIMDLRRKLTQSSSQFAIEIHEGLNNISESDLTWRELLTNQVLSDESNLVQNLSGSAKNSFMRSSHKMRVQLPSNIRDICTNFVKNFYDDDMEGLLQRLTHNNTWIESDETLVNVTDDILNSLCEIWRNPAFDGEFANTQSEGTYVTDVIVPLI